MSVSYHCNNKINLSVTSGCFTRRWLGVTVIIMVIGCATNPGGDCLEQGLSRSTYTVILADTLGLTIPSYGLNNYKQRHLLQDSLLYLYDNRLPGKVDVFNIRSESFSHRIELSTLGFASDLGNMFVKNKDSLFFLGDHSKKLYLFSGAGKYLRSWGLSGLSFTTADGFTTNDFIFPTMLFDVGPFIGNDLQLYLTLAPVGIEDNNEVARVSELQAIYDLKKEKYLFAYAPYEGFMREKGNMFYPYDVSFPYRLVLPDQILISYPLDHVVYHYDKKTGKLLKRTCFAVKEALAFPSGLSQEQIDDRELSWNLRVTTPFYGPVFYHRALKLYSRIYYHEQELFDNEGYVNSGADRIATLILMNQQGKKVNETTFRNGLLGVHKVIALPDGWLAASNSHYWKEENELVYKYLFSIEGL